MNKIAEDLGFVEERAVHLTDMISDVVISSKRPSDLIRNLADKELTVEEAVYVGYLVNKVANDPMIRIAIEMRKESDLNQDSEGTSSEANMQKVFEMLKAFSK